MTAFVRLKNTGQLMCVVERIEAGPCRMLKGYVEGVKPVTIRREDATVPEPGAPMPGLHLVGEGE